MRQRIFHDLAKQDLKQIRKYTINSWGQNQTNKYLKGLTQTVQLIKQNPFIGFKKKEIQDGAYCLFYKSHAIYYQFTHDKVVITAVLHQSMNIKATYQIE